LATADWVPSSITATGSPLNTNLPQINGYPFHPSEQNMISAAGIKDQQLTIIVSMMLIELALLRLWPVLPVGSAPLRPIRDQSI
jgi:hypothetical protein